MNSTNPCKTVYPLRQSPQSALPDQQPEVMENMKYLEKPAAPLNNDLVYSIDSLLHCSQPLLGPFALSYISTALCLLPTSRYGHERSGTFYSNGL